MGNSPRFSSHCSSSNTDSHPRTSTSFKMRAKWRKKRVRRLKRKRRKMRAHVQQVAPDGASHCGNGHLFRIVLERLHPLQHLAVVEHALDVDGSVLDVAHGVDEVLLKDRAVPAEHNAVGHTEDEGEHRENGVDRRAVDGKDRFRDDLKDDEQRQEHVDREEHHDLLPASKQRTASNVQLEPCLGLVFPVASVRVEESLVTVQRVRIAVAETARVKETALAVWRTLPNRLGVRTTLALCSQHPLGTVEPLRTSTRILSPLLGIFHS